MPDALPPLTTPHRQDHEFSRVLIANQRPVESHQHPDREDHRTDKVDQPKCAHDEMVTRFTAQGRQRVGDEIAGYAEHDDRDRVHPVPDAYRHLIDVDRSLRLFAFRH